MHTPYSETRGHEFDFRVKYNFYSKEEGGRAIIPYQGIRCDFFYEHPDHYIKNNLAFMIWPEFEDENGNVILDNTKSVAKTGNARMWVINRSMIDYHCKKIYIGMKCFFVEGPKRTAECEIIEFGGLCDESSPNPSY